MRTIFGKLTPEQKELMKNCKSPEEQDALLSSGKIAISDEQMGMVSGGGGSDNKGCLHPEWHYGVCCHCPEGMACPAYGDSRDDVSPEHISSAFAQGKITGAEFFASV